jgi:hypothetical protein
MHIPGQGVEKPGLSTVRKVLSNRAFRLLWTGQGTSYLGDQFYMLALSWLVLQLTGDALALGTVLAAGGVPRAAFMLLGGAITDRFSSRVVMILSDLGRLVLTASLAVVVLAGAAELWSLYLFALAFGSLSGLFLPASNAIVPRILDTNDLQAGNALVQGTAQAAAFAGPLFAGSIIALFPGEADSSHRATGIALAFAIDSLTFLASVVTLWLIGSFPGTPHEARGSAGSAEQILPRTNMLSSIFEGFRYVRSNSLLRTILAVAAVMNLLLTGPLLVGIPVVAATRLAEGAAALGIIMAAFAGGNLVGYAFAGSLPRANRLGLRVPFILASFGIILGVTGLLASTPALSLLLFALGTGNGYLTIALVTWLQQRTPQDLLGRMMSLLLFANMGVVPLSQALAGIALGWSLTGLFLGAGTLVLVVAALLSLSRELREVRF